ncbi:MAG: sigma 54-interacting transcriptional regulator [Firmicutes bacterium]|nr:sigma 54-interacting transcriptional regulator [Bacillota bacterium]
MNFTKSYNDILKNKWQCYIADNQPMPEAEPEIRDFIYESWKRSKAHQVSPFDVKAKKLSPSELRQVLNRSQPLIRAAHSYIQHLYSFVKGTNFVLALTDADGYVLDLLGDDDMIQARTKKSGLTIGCCRSEEYAGTNGIGTCLMVGKPIQVWACEHYIKPHHGYVCSAAPIRSIHGEIIGCLDVVGPIGLPHNHTLAMVSASADSIEKELKMADAYERISLVNSQMASAIQAIDSGMIMFNNMGMIVQYNKRACQVLNLTPEMLDNANIANIIDLQNSTFNPFEITRNVQNREVSLLTCKQERISLSLSMSIIKNDTGQQMGTVLVINELKKIHTLVNQLNGFTATYTFDSILGESPSICSVKEMAKAAAQSRSNVLILGESGTGKELIAQAIHNASDRSLGPFIAINCGSLPKGLIESELFGYERGAFTGANKEGHPGKFELAQGGTIFLDEIGDMPLELQASLLRVLQSKEIVRIGGKQKKEIDVRIMAATNVNLLESVGKKEFRDDLYYRLNVLSIEVPPLRERKTDITLLASHFIRSMSRILGKNIEGIEEDAKEILSQYNWPGNIRELENVIERAVNLTSRTTIGKSELPPSIIQAVQASDSPTQSEQSAVSGSGNSSEDSAGNRSYQLLVEALAAERGNVSRTSERLGIPKRTLYRRIKRYNININEFRLL